MAIAASGLFLFAAGAESAPLSGCYERRYEAVHRAGTPRKAVFERINATPPDKALSTLKKTVECRLPSPIRARSDTCAGRCAPTQGYKLTCRRHRWPDRGPHQSP
jgi:hypothetical protein